eukprot:TRINITY_DN22373_c0_g1_i1.p1 TRINITY_DN22373_c0_g1~~TRINITY_DN22373_c0_g1_i1.p1  ORF type:complete len:447 (+),score=93.79 TRINITY_DN22373_c0_g1_i1:108-1448(+)
MVVPQETPSMLDGTITGLCRASYYISLLGLKIPAGLLVRASRARHVLAFICFVWVPFLIYCHFSLVPAVREAQYGTIAWHVVIAVWMTIPLLTVGSVILFRVQAKEPMCAFFAALTFMGLLHTTIIPAIAPTFIGTALLQFLFAFFEVLPIVAWIWCLWHVVKLQDHIASSKQAKDDLPRPVGPAEGPEDKVLIVGNAPTVVDGEPLGCLIDGFQHVVRFNTYSVAKTEYTGSKVNFHFCNGRNFPASKDIRAVLPLFNASLTHAVYLFMPHMEEARQIYANLTCNKVDTWFVDEDIILELRRQIGVMPWQIPTSGAVAIGSFLSQRKEVMLHGFNFFQGKKIHYFEESPTQLITSWLERFVTHDPASEKVWVEKLKKEGRAKMLAETVAAATAEAEGNDEAEGKAEIPSPSKADKELDEDGNLRQRTPSLMRTLLKDGLPSQFSI